MACKSCSTNNKTYNKQTESVCSTNASDIQYTGPNLSCLGVQTNSNLDEVFSNINDIVCSEITIDWSSFDYSCLEGGSTAKDFVEEISAEFCSLETDVNTFLGTTFPSYQSTINSRFIDIEIPEIESICTINGISITDSDNIQTILQKLSNISCYLNTQLNPSSANWNSCYTVSPTPTTIVGGFNTLISQICSIKSTVDGWTGLLPTFNNIGTCLPTPSATESLYNTVIKIRDKACSAISYDVDEVTWQTCVGNPTATEGTTIEDTISHLTYYIEQSLLGRITSVSDDFNLELTTPGSPCDGLRLEFNPGGTFANNQVALDSDDTAGFLLDKLTAGSNITFDTVTNEGEIIINASVGTDQYIRITSNDTTSDYLNNKIQGSTGEITISTTVIGSGNESLQISASLNSDTAADNILDAILLDSALQAKFCTAVSNCNSTPSGNSNAFYVSSSQQGIGNGSVISPFKTIDEAYNAVVGNGTPDNPQFSDALIYTYKGVYTTSQNIYITGASYYFEDGTSVQYNGTGYFIDASTYPSITKVFYLTGGLSFSSSTGAFIYIKGNAGFSYPSHTFDIEVTNLSTTTNQPGSALPLIKVECTPVSGAHSKPTLNLRVNNSVNTINQTIGWFTGSPRITIEGGIIAYTSPSPVTGTVLYWDDPSASNTRPGQGWLRLKNTRIAGSQLSTLLSINGNNSIESELENIIFARSAVGLNTTAITLNDVIIYNDSTETTSTGFQFRNCTVIDSHFSATEVIVGTRSTSNENRIELINCILGSKEIDLDNITLNYFTEGGYNIIQNTLNVSNLPTYDDVADAITNGKVVGSVFKDSSGALYIV